MGIVIFTNDDSKFLEGNYVLMTGQIDTPPSNPEVTYILRTTRFKEKDVVNWLPYIQNRLVVCIDKPPKLSKKIQEYVIIDDTYKKRPNGFMSNITSILTWKNRLRVFTSIKDLPIPYGLAFLRKNRDDINLWRRIARANMELPDEYTRAIFAYSVEPDNEKIVWPDKKKTETITPKPFRQNDKYWEEIIKGSESVANELRVSGQELPKGVKKRKQVVNEWL